MTISRSLLRYLVIAAAFPLIGLGLGCNSSNEIPLAKVGDPPKDFGKPVTTPKTPRGGSPENSTDYGRKQ
jgi:hypothetical protein